MDVTFWLALAALLLAAWAVVRAESYRARVIYCELSYRLESEAAQLRYQRDVEVSGRLSALQHDVKYLDERIANLESYANLLSQAPAVQCDVPPWSVPVLRTPSEPKPEVRNVEEGG